MFHPKRLLPLAGSAVAIGLCFNPIPARALQLTFTLFGQELLNIPDRGRNQIKFRVVS